jgi:hypothetical protein
MFFKLFLNECQLYYGRRRLRVVVYIYPGEVKSLHESNLNHGIALGY